MPEPKPRVLFMGTPDFAVPALSALCRDGFPIVGVVTQPDRPQGRGRLTAPSPVKRLAESLGLPLLQPEKVRTPLFLETFRNLAPEIVVVVAFGQILPAEIVAAPPLGCINIHPSLLPRYRGAAPIHWALIRGDETTGVTIMQMDEGIDSGPILLQRATPIGADESFGELHDRLASLGAEMLVETIAGIAAGTIRPEAQDDSQATAAPRLTPETGEIRWQEGCRPITSLIRGLSPVPGAHTSLDGRKLKIFTAFAEPSAVREAPGTVIGTTGEALLVAAGDGAVRVTELQLEGKKRMSARDFLRGFRIVAGQRLGRAAAPPAAGAGGAGDKADG